MDQPNEFAPGRVFHVEPSPRAVPVDCSRCGAQIGTAMDRIWVRGKPYHPACDPLKMPAKECL
jgi:hypothetical protein